MYRFYFDCGTSKTRGYLLRDGDVIGLKSADVGSKDVSIRNDNSILIGSMREIYTEVLGKLQLIDSDVSEIYASGMVTSPFGLVEVSHIVTPVDKRTMKNNIHEYRETKLFNRSIKLIPGVKTAGGAVTVQNIDKVNNVRGEEIEIFGICNHLPQDMKSSRYVIILPGSHTHSVLMEGGTLKDIYSTFSGELFHAVKTSTILSNSTAVQDERPLDMEAVEKGCSNLHKYGLPRAMYQAHAMKVFGVGDNNIRNDYLNAVINGSVVQSLSLNIESMWKDVSGIVVYAGERMAAIYSEAVRLFMPELAGKTTCLNREQINCAVEGLLAIINS